MIRRCASVALIVIFSSLVVCEQVRAQSKERPATGEQRLAAIRRAQVWAPTDIASKDLTAGPQGPGALPPNATVQCDYIEKKMSGRSPKFTCRIAPDDEVKVKYGRNNGEVFGEVAASRLLWALGFLADRMYPVRVVCRGCPPTVQDTEFASIQRKFAGKDIETGPGSGWKWPELDLVDPAAGGAPRAQRDALKLLAVFLQHSDNKAEQQRLVCVGAVKEQQSEQSEQGPSSEGRQKAQDQKGQDEPCIQTAMIMHDLGLTFGHATLLNKNGSSSVNFDEWSATPVWKDPARCIANLKKSFTGTLENPPIREEGRKFLADLLTQLSDNQLRQLFEVSRFQQRVPAAGERAPAAGASGSATIDRWVDVFKQKRTEIVNTTCPL
jgi:hypothetical protein